MSNNEEEHEEEAEERKRIFKTFQINANLLNKAKKNVFIV